MIIFEVKKPDKIIQQFFGKYGNFTLLLLN